MHISGLQNNNIFPTSFFLPEKNYPLLLLVLSDSSMVRSADFLGL
jgi:hypothetical protein